MSSPLLGALLALLSPPAVALEITIEAAVAGDLRTISGTLHLDDPSGLTLADPLALLPAAPDDRSTFRTWPGRPERGAITWEAAGEGTWRFTTALPRRYGALGVLPRRGLWACGGWYPQPLREGAVPVADWSVSVALPEGSVGLVGDSIGRGVLRWSGSGERAALAVLLRGRIDQLTQDDVTVVLLEDGPERRARDERLVATFAEAWTLVQPGRIAVVESPQLRRLTRAAPGALFLSDRAFRMTGSLADYHRVAVARGLLQAALPVRDPWARAIAADAMARDYQERVEAADAEALLRWGAWIPEVDALLYDGSVPFVSELFVETFPGDPLRDDLLELFAPRTPGQVVSVKLDDRYGPGTALALARRLVAGEELDAAAAALGVREGLEPWRAPYPEQDYTLKVDPVGQAVSVRRIAPPGAAAEPVVIAINGVRQTWLAGPGPDAERWVLATRPQQVVLDPDHHITQADTAGERWPPKWTAVFAFFPYAINLSDGTFSAAASATLRKQYDTHNLFDISAFTDPVNFAGATLTWRYAAGPLLDRRSRPHRFYLSVTPAVLDPVFRPTDAGSLALGAGLAWRYDDRVDYLFPLSGRSLYLGADGGFVPGSEQRWGSLASSAGGVWSPHPRHALAGQVKAGLATGEVEHRLLTLGGASGLRSVPVGAAVGERRALVRGEYRLALIRNASVPMGFAWGSELQLTAGLEAGALGGARLASGERVPLVQAAGWTVGVAGIGDLLGARPTLLGLTAAGPLSPDPPTLAGAAPVQIYLRWFQSF